MSQGTDGVQAPASQDLSTAALVKQLSEQVSTLMRDELKLARLEMTRKGKAAGTGVGMLGGAGMIALYGVACLVACAVIAFAGAVTAWLAALIVGIALLAAAGIAALLGRSRLQRATPPMPQEAAESVKADVEEIKERTRR